MAIENREMSLKEKADLYLALAEGARRRFEDHHKVEWRIHFGLWTFFVAGAVLAATSPWVPSPGACIVGTLFSLFIVVVYWYCWLPHSHHYREECTRSGWWWESYARELLPKEDCRFPRHLKPRAKGKGKWREPADEDWDPDPEDPEAFDWGKRHTSHNMCMVVTCVLMLLLLGALWDKWWHGPPGRDDPVGGTRAPSTTVLSHPR